MAQESCLRTIYVVLQPWSCRWPDSTENLGNVFGRAGSHPADDGSRNKRESGHLRPRFASERGIITARDRAKTRTRQRLNFCCALVLLERPHGESVVSWTRISSAQEPLRPMPLPRPSRVTAARDARTGPWNGVSERWTTGQHGLHPPLPAKSGRTRPPLSIPSAAKFHPPTETARRAASRLTQRKPQRRQKQR